VLQKRESDPGLWPMHGVIVEVEGALDMHVFGLQQVM
jgi:hypothetical protein